MFSTLGCINRGKTFLPMGMKQIDHHYGLFDIKLNTIHTYLCIPKRLKTSLATPTRQPLFYANTFSNYIFEDKVKLALLNHRLMHTCFELFAFAEKLIAKKNS